MNALHPTILRLLPEVVLSIGGILALFFGTAFMGLRRDRAPWIALFSLAAAAFVATSPVFAVAVPETPGLIADALTYYVRMTVFAVGALIVLVNWHVPEDGERAEFFSLLLFTLCGASLVGAADDLLLLFLALELVSVPGYVLIGLSRSRGIVHEATVKYFFLGAFAAAITLYGFGFLYGAAGTTVLHAGGSVAAPSLATMFAGEAAGGMLARVGLLLAFVGLSFKIAAFPLHFYVADVYQGAAAPVSGMLGFVPKLAGFTALIRLMDASGWRLDDGMFWAVWAVAAATMFAGNTLALMQRDNIKRMLAYSSIAHSGYMLVALLAGPGSSAITATESPLRNGVAAVLFYMTIYGVMNLGAFAALAYFRGRSANGEPIESFEDLADTARSRPWAALGLAICCLGLMGLPPTAGQWGKIAVFSAALSVPESHPHAQAMIVLVVLGVINAAIAAAYYLRIVSHCIMGEAQADAPPPTACRRLQLGLALCAIIVLAVFLRPGAVLTQAETAAAGFRSRPAAIATALPAEGPARH